MTYNPQGKRITSENLAGQVTTTAWDCCHKVSENRPDVYGYNLRGELVSATKNTEDTEYAYQYDDIGNRITSLDLGTNRTYTANNLNQYTLVGRGDPTAPQEEFTPQFDLDMRPRRRRRVARRSEATEPRSGRKRPRNQTLIKTSTDTWSVTYNGEIRMMQPGGHAFFCTHDGNKNVSEVFFFQQAYGIAAHYEYAPFGAVTAATRNTSVTSIDARTFNPFRFSSEYADETLGLVYYNYRHYEPVTGRWLRRDPLYGGIGANVYLFCRNQLVRIDVLGLLNPHEFFDEWDEGERLEWVKRFKDKYRTYICEAAKVKCVPGWLLAGIIMNEQIDYTWYEDLLDPLFGNSLGPAQLTVETLEKYGLLVVPDSWFSMIWIPSDMGPGVVSPQEQAAKRKRDILNNDKKNIELAASLLCLYICKHGKDKLGNEFSLSFRTDIIYNDIEVEIGEDTIEDMKQRRMLAIFAAIWNNDYDITRADNIRDTKSNAYWHAWNIRGLQKYLKGFCDD